MSKKKEITVEEMANVIEAMSETEKEAFFSECFAELEKELFG